MGDTSIVKGVIRQWLLRGLWVLVALAAVGSATFYFWR
jgi:hypothetical protein